MKAIKRLLYWLYCWFTPGGGTLDPFADKMAPIKKTPPTRRGGVAVAEPDDQ